MKKQEQTDWKSNKQQPKKQMLYIYTYMYVCMYVCIYIYMYVYIYTLEKQVNINNAEIEDTKMQLKACPNHEINWDDVSYLDKDNNTGRRLIKKLYT